MTTANKITIVRILLIPVFVMLAVYYGDSVQQGERNEALRLAAILVFLTAAVSDGLDGYVARHYNQRSKLGTILDPIADKGLLLAGLLTLTFSDWGYHFPLWFPVLVITRDVVIVAGSFGLHYLNGEVHVRPRWTGKVATVLSDDRPRLGDAPTSRRFPGRVRGAGGVVYLHLRRGLHDSTASASSSTTNTPGPPNAPA